MKTMNERIRLRLRADRPMTTIALKLPQDVIDDLDEIAPLLGFAGHLPLMRNYIGAGLRDDLFKLEDSPMRAVAESLREQGVPDATIAIALAGARERA